MNPNYNTPSSNDYPNLSSSLNSPIGSSIQPITNSGMGLGSSQSLSQTAPILNHTLQQPPQCIKQELTQHNLMHNDSSLPPAQPGLLINNNSMNVMSNPNGNLNSMNNNLNNMNHRNHQAINTVPITMPTKSPYAQMSILERNSNQMHQQQQQQHQPHHPSQQHPQQQQPTGSIQQTSSIHPQNSAQQQSNNLIAANPILNNLITSNTISTNLVQNNFIQLNAKTTAKNINISNGITNQPADTNQPTYIESTASLNPSECSLAPINLCDE